MRPRPRLPRSHKVVAVSVNARSRIPRADGARRLDRALAGFRRTGDRSDQVPPRSRHLLGEPTVSAEELEQLAHEYRHVHEDHHRAPPRSRVRRDLEARLREVRDRFERLLAEAPVSDVDRRRWRDRLRRGVEAPSSPTDVPSLLFRGRSDTGSELRLAAGRRGTIDAFVDGAAVAVLDDAQELTTTKPGLVFALDGLRFRETFGASPPSIADLRDALTTGRRPRPRHIRELIEEGLVDRTLGVTARGRRALALDVLPARHAETTPTPAIRTHGPVSRYAGEKLARALTEVVRVAPGPVLRVTASLTRHEDPARSRPFVAKATISVGARIVRAQAAAASENEAVALLESRLRRNLRERPKQ